ncbi:imm11 family protein [Pseudobacteroides cellulosolvens]|uniref:Immunity MXAN-0049 protein domain-containing protein n=2 Tax=Pseudobacteroides cellulosolvens TaxID=35825 RepID=A0A0L6JWT3_9FIRM|nr:DUF1629 domain-containing protein [Pseudobacteroides cellulosolvens]KNY30065.1 hypothetical protein Bccel_5342 [Pseudobacteroides cellulosolvens ATCC 35603 = DSM 2933]
MNFYVIEEDTNSKNKIFLDEINIAPEERKNMILGLDSYIPEDNLLINIKHMVSEEMSDYLSLRFTFVSHKLKCIIQDNTNAKIFFRDTFFLYDGMEFNYYFCCPQKIDCISYEISDKPSNNQAEKIKPGIMKISNGFSIMEKAIENTDIFRVEGLSSRSLVISERLKGLLEENDVKGIKYTLTNQWQNM